MQQRNTIPATSAAAGQGPINAARLAAHEKRAPASALVSAQQAAREVFGVSERTFHTLRQEPWMPAPVVCGPRLLRWVRAELEAAVCNMPRQAEPKSEPAQLRRQRIEKMKRGGAA